MKETPGQILDPVRKKWVAATPEEMVRQKLILHLNKKCGVPVELMMCEYSFDINGNKYRSDLVIFSASGEPLMVAECKAPGVKIGEDVFSQIFTYNYILKVKYLLLTNGSVTYCATFDGINGKMVFLNKIPNYNELLEK